ncbi:hypothetical protein PRJ_1654 [Pseudomonas sp. XWY-1]|nr:hypothetical protein PRJ_1654 [Pseudomonas sp. XWY-1]
MLAGSGIVVACAGLFAGKPAPTKACDALVGAGLPAKRPAQATTP